VSTVRDLITSALRTARAIGADQTPSENESSTGLRQLNAVLETWDVQGLMPYADQVTDSTLVAGQASYTVGPTGDIVMARPNILRSVRFLFGNVWRDLQLVSFQDWAEAELNDTLQTLPVVAHWNPAFPNGELSVYPAPGASYPVRLVSAISVSGVDLETVLQLPPGYEPALEFELASILGGIFHIADLGDVRSEAIRRIGLVKRMRDQSRALTAWMAPTGSPRGRFNMQSYRAS
jgi:hypothetical protein